MDINELISDVQDAISDTVAYLTKIHRRLNERPIPPQGRSIEDKVLSAYIGECIADARKLESKLYQF